MVLCVPTLARADSPEIPPQAQEQARKLAEEPPKPPPPAKTVKVDASGRKEGGKASIYSPEFDGKTMADGRKLNPQANVAASKTLPLGTVAKVTNLANGKSTEVKVEDRGPFVAGRVVDLTPQAARQIGLTERKGVTPVVVAPVAIPTPDGGVKLGAGAAEVGNVGQAVKQVDPSAKVGEAE
jgi:rare lipoprotein A